MCRDVFVCLPTGSGKSLCYCILPYAFDELRSITGTEKRSIVLVVSPLIALMKDQVRSMVERNITAIYAAEADDKAVEDIILGRYQLVFMSPEMLLRDENWRDMLVSTHYQENLMAFVVDEAHCVKKWYTCMRDVSL